MSLFQFTGDVGVAEVGAAALREHCVNALVTDPATIKAPPTAVLNKLCPNDCSGNGMCNAGR